MSNLHLDLYCQTAWHIPKYPSLQMLHVAHDAMCGLCRVVYLLSTIYSSTATQSVIATHNSHIDMTLTCLYCRTANSYYHALPFDVLWFPTHQVQTKVKIDKRLFCIHNTRNCPSTFCIATPIFTSGLLFRNGITSPTITPTSLSSIKSDDDDDDYQWWWCDDTQQPTVPTARPRPRHPPYGWLVPAPPVSRPDLATSGLRPAAARGPEAGCGEAGARRHPRPADHWLIRTSRHNRGHAGHGENPRHLSRNWNFSSNIPKK